MLLHRSVPLSCVAVRFHQLDGRPPEQPLAQRTCQALRELLGADGASVTIDNLTVRRVTLCATDERSEKLENLQDALGEGPCRGAFTSRLPVTTGMDRWAASRWPEFIPAAERIIGPRGVLWSLPMRIADTLVGTISVYRLAGDALAAQILADAAALMLLADLATLPEVTDADPRASRSVVHQAVGKLMAQLDTGADDALAVLRSYAFTADTQLAEVARAVLNGTLDLYDR